MEKLLPSLVPVFYLLVLPLGVAGQNIGLGVALACSFILFYLDKGRHLKNALSYDLLKQFLILWGLLIASVTIATAFASENKEATRFFWGYCYGAVIPIMGVMVVGEKSGQYAKKTFQFILCLLGIVAVSQLIWAWKFESGSFVQTIHRAQGFYSHPLTLAYVALVTMPWSIAYALRDLKNIGGLVVCLATIAIILSSQSVTVIALTFIVGMIAVFWFLTGKTRWLVLALVGLTTIGILATPNSVSKKIDNVLSGERGDHETNYPDDRMAFWHAHWEMFKDAPWIGHGSGLEPEDRAPYYARIGLPDIKRKYEAHNMFLEYAVEGGVVAVLAFFGLLIWLVRIAINGKDLAKWEKFYLVVTPVAFAIGGLTQNAIQDSEVRYVFLGFIAVLLNRVLTVRVNHQA